MPGGFCLIYYDHYRGADKGSVWLGMRSLSLAVALQLCRFPLQRLCDGRGSFEGWYGRGKWLLVVKACSNVFCGCFRRFFAWSFSMLSGGGFLVVVRVDCGHYISGNVDGVECLV